MLLVACGDSDLRNENFPTIETYAEKQLYLFLVTDLSESSAVTLNVNIRISNIWK
jgi:hypothetical protein